MTHCKRCFTPVEIGSSHCPGCGEKQKVPGRFPWRKMIIALLLLFLAAGSAYLVYEQRLLAQQEDQENAILPDQTDAFNPNRLEKEDNPLAGPVYGSELRDSFNYPGGKLMEYSAFDETGNRVTLFKDEETGDTVGFTINAPPAARVTVSADEALKKAEEMAIRAPFFNDPNLKLIKSALQSNIFVDGNPDAGGQYEFFWHTVDSSSGAYLLRSIEVIVHAETGQVIHFGYHDRGEVTVSTRPDISGDEAAEAALARAERTFSSPQEVGRKLLVAAEGSSQRLYWEIIVEESIDADFAQALWIYVDAFNGRVQEVKR